MPNRKRVSHKAGEAPKSLEQAFKKAREDHEAGNLVAARKQYRNLLKEHPHNAPLLFSKAVVLFQLDQIDEALPFLHRAIENDPENLEYINALGVFQRNMRLFNDAIQTFKKMLKTNPDCYEALHNLGLVYGDMHNYEKAIKYYKKALKIAPRNEDTLSNLAHALRDVNKPDEALGYYQQLADLHPKSHRHLLNLAVMLHGLGKFEDAVNYFERVVALDPTDKNTQHLLRATKGDLEVKEVPESYVTGLFDAYADDFDMHLAALEYKVPAMLAARIPMVVAPKTKRGQWDVLDLGCGTGACGRYFHEYCKTLVGIDLSKEMLKHAEEHGVYTELKHIGIESYLDQTDQQFDIIFATDVLVYMGDLEALFKKVAAHLKKGGLFAFSTELAENKEGNFVLRNSGRFAQSDEYILKLAKLCKLKKMINSKINVRMGHNEPIPGRLYILRK